MAELGCGWGCWMNNTGVAARRRGHSVHLIGVEGDEGHIGFAHEACAANGFAPEQTTIIHGIAASREGIALFPRQERAGHQWELEPIFDASPSIRDEALATGSHDALPMISLSRMLGKRERLDLLHIDIQGGEADLVRDSLEFLSRRVAYMVIGTHSRQIEGRLFDDLLGAGWRLEIERPALINLESGTPVVRVDGVQGWRNACLLPY